MSAMRPSISSPPAVDDRPASVCPGLMVWGVQVSLEAVNFRRGVGFLFSGELAPVAPAETLERGCHAER
jgi:hypothetical protein